jgi:hypothetical protein
MRIDVDDPMCPQLIEKQISKYGYIDNRNFINVTYPFLEKLHDVIMSYYNSHEDNLILLQDYMYRAYGMVSIDSILEVSYKTLIDGICEIIFYLSGNSIRLVLPFKDIIFVKNLDRVLEKFGKYEILLQIL